MSSLDVSTSFGADQHQPPTESLLIVRSSLLYVFSVWCQSLGKLGLANLSPPMRWSERIWHRLSKSSITRIDSDISMLIDVKLVSKRLDHDDRTWNSFQYFTKGDPLSIPKMTVCHEGQPLIVWLSSFDWSKSTGQCVTCSWIRCHLLWIDGSRIKAMQHLSVGRGVPAEFHLC
jgi:hypothetical protein